MKPRPLDFTDLEAIEPQPSPLHIGKEVAGWALALLACFHGLIEDALLAVPSWPVVAGGYALSVILAVVSSYLLRSLCQPGWKRWTRFHQALWTLLPASFLASAPWTATMTVLFVSSGYFPDHWRWTFAPVIGTYFFLLTLTRGVMLLHLNLSRKARFERERSLLMEALATRARAASLRERLSPHFLFNALNSVVGLVHRRPSQAQEMTRDIIALLERLLESSPEETSIRGELDFITHYLRCESVRFGPRLEIAYDIDPRLLELPIPRFLLQPVVENAVKYGLRQEGRVFIGLHGQLRDRRIIIEVRNPGALERPRDHLDIQRHLVKDGTGNGLQIVRQRLQATFGDCASLELSAEREGVVLARLSYPAESLKPSSRVPPHLYPEPSTHHSAG